MQLLAATKLENERVRVAALPMRTNPEPGKLLAEALLYQWMQTLVVGLKTYSEKDTN